MPRDLSVLSEVEGSLIPKPKPPAPFGLLSPAATLSVGAMDSGALGGVGGGGGMPSDSSSLRPEVATIAAVAETCFVGFRRPRAAGRARVSAGSVLKTAALLPPEVFLPRSQAVPPPALLGRSFSSADGRLDDAALGRGGKPGRLTRPCGDWGALPRSGGG